MPENVTPERTQLLKMYGAEIVYSEGSLGSNGAVEKALEMAQEDSSVYMPYQYGNQANPNAHYNGTALEILEELDEVSAFVAGLGTGGTLMGNGRRLKETFGDEVKIVAAEPMQGEPVQGLRSLDDGFIPPIIDISLLDRKIFVTNHDAIVWTRKLLDEEGSVRGSLQRRDRLDRGANRGRAGRGERRVRSLRRRLEVPVERHLHAAGRRGREPRLHRLVVGGDRPAGPIDRARRWRTAGRGRRRRPRGAARVLGQVAASRRERRVRRGCIARTTCTHPLKFEIDQRTAAHYRRDRGRGSSSARSTTRTPHRALSVADRHQLRGQLARSRVGHRRALADGRRRRCAPI